MLILTRRFKESVIVGNDIVLTVLGGRDGEIRIGISAPKNVAVDRSELRARKLAGPLPATKMGGAKVDDVLNLKQGGPIEI